MDRTPVISLGAGVQSSTMLLMAARGELDELSAIGPSLAIFADTQWEEPRTYEWLPFLRMQAWQSGIEVATSSHGDLRADVLARAEGRADRASMPPLYTVNPDGSRGFTQRQCTRDYKVRPVRQELRRRGFGEARPVEVWIAITVDEIERVKASDVQWASNRHPFVELGWRRIDCERWLRDRDYPLPPRSACVGCPHHSNAHWFEMRERRPEQWADAVEFDRSIRSLPGLRGEGYLHEQRVPLDQVVLDPSDYGQGSFASECEGMCGV